MFDKIKEYFQEGTKMSFTRLASGAVIATGLLIALVEVIAYLFDHSIEVHSGLVGELVFGGLGAKVVQKSYETKQD